MLDEDSRLIAALDCYFIDEEGARFKVPVPHEPYFYVAARAGRENEALSYLCKKYDGLTSSVDLVDKEDLDLVCTIVDYILQ